MRSFLYSLVVAFSVMVMAGCQKDNSVAPASTKQTIKTSTIMTADSTKLTGHDDDPKHPKT